MFLGLNFPVPFHVCLHLGLRLCSSRNPNLKTPYSRLDIAWPIQLTLTYPGFPGVNLQPSDSSWGENKSLTCSLAKLQRLPFRLGSKSWWESSRIPALMTAERPPGVRRSAGLPAYNSALLCTSTRLHFRLSSLNVITSGTRWGSMLCPAPSHVYFTAAAARPNDYSSGRETCFLYKVLWSLVLYRCLVSRL